MHASLLQMQRVLTRSMDRLQTVRTELEDTGLTMCIRLYLVSQVVYRLLTTDFVISIFKSLCATTQKV